MAYTITATPETASARVRVDVTGGTPGDPLYVFRRDSAGVGVVRDTSLATVLWPATVDVLNAFRNPAVRTGLTDWTVSAGTGGTAAMTRPTTTLPDGSSGAVERTTWSVATTAVGGGFDADSGPGAIPSAATDRFGAVWVRSSITQRLQLIAQHRTDAGVVVGTNTNGTAVVVTANTWTRLTVPFTSPATATRVVLSVRAVTGTSGVVWPINATLDGVRAQVTPTDVPYFDGTTPNTTLVTYSWQGTADASFSLAATFVPVTVYDNEARQGEANVDYLLADADGVMLASVRIGLPLWGTWLKSPGRPFLNVRCYLESEGKVTRPARRQVVPVEGSTAPVVLSQPRAGKTGSLKLVSLDAETDDAISRLLDRGDTLMVDTDPAWRIAYRYVNVGDLGIERGYWSDRELQLPARIFELADLVAVEAPIGVTAVEAGRTYATLPTLYGSYAAMAATVGTYEELATGISA